MLVIRKKYDSYTDQLGLGEGLDTILIDMYTEYDNDEGPLKHNTCGTHMELNRAEVLQLIEYLQANLERLK